VHCGRDWRIYNKYIIKLLDSQALSSRTSPKAMKGCDMSLTTPSGKAAFKPPDFAADEQPDEPPTKHQPWAVAMSQTPTIFKLPYNSHTFHREYSLAI
jgi:hypothetical protein